VTVVLTGDDLTLGEVVRVARGRERVELAPSALERMHASRSVVEEALERPELVYGLNVGVGMRKRFRVPHGDMGAFNRRLVLNHRVAQGPLAADDEVRAMMLRLANGFAKGTVGVSPLHAERLVDALNDGSTPRVRSLGSWGMGDLPQTADLAYALFADVELGAKDGIGLLNSGCWSTALAALALVDATTLLDALDVAAALDLEAFAGNLSILHRAVGATRPYPGLAESLARFRALLSGSALTEAGTARNLQDPLTFRNAPHVHGALREALAHTRATVNTELNASQDNPLVVVDERRLISCANYELLPLALALDFLRLALAPALTSAAERGLKLLQEPLSGLHPGLAGAACLVEDSLSEFGVPLQALAAEARLLSQPVSSEVVSTTHAEGIEDRITLAPLAARRLAQMVELGARIVAIDVVLACQAIDLRGPPRLGAGTGAAYRRVREVVPFSGPGDPIPQDLEPVVDLVRAGAFAGAAG
jgi:histidine ammonia-lyase